MTRKMIDLYRQKGIKKELEFKWIRTPDIIWEDLKSEFDFTVDACASDYNHLLPKYWTKETDALKQNWNDEVIYCQPMFNQQIPKFLKKAIESNSLCVFLLPAGTNSNYFHDMLWDSKLHKPKDNIEIRFLPKADWRYGYKFKNEIGEEPETGYLRPLMLIIINKNHGNT